MLDNVFLNVLNRSKQNRIKTRSRMLYIAIVQLNAQNWQYAHRIACSRHLKCSLHTLFFDSIAIDFVPILSFFSFVDFMPSLMIKMCVFVGNRLKHSSTDLSQIVVDVVALIVPFILVSIFFTFVRSFVCWSLSNYSKQDRKASKRLALFFIIQK